MISEPRLPAAAPCTGGPNLAWLARLIRLARLAAVALLLAGASGLAQAAQGYEARDDRGQLLRFAAPPQRVVSLLPSITESICALGACQRLAGVDRYANWPASVQALPRVGGGQDPDVEAILALKPDLVFMAAGSRAAPRLQALGLRVAQLDTRTQADVRRVLHTLAAMLALPGGQAEQTWQSIENAVDEAARGMPAQARGASVFFEVSSGPYAAGESSFIGETLQRLGVRNVVGAALGPFPHLNPEYVLEHRPDVLMATSRSQLAAQPYPGWEKLPAWREGRLCIFNAEETDTLIRPGPRMAEAARLMARCLAAKAPRASPGKARATPRP